MNPQVIVALITALVLAAVSYGVLIQQNRQTRADVREIKRVLNGNEKAPGLVKRVETLEGLAVQAKGQHRRPHTFSAQGDYASSGGGYAPGGSKG